MAFWTPTQIAALAQGVVRWATLVDLDFADGEVNLWNGFGPLTVGAKVYVGCGDLGAIDGLEEIRTPESQRVTLTLSGVADSMVDILAIALDADDVVQGRDVTIYQLFFDEAWQPVGDPVPIYMGIMQQPRITREPATPEQGARRTISLPCENRFFGRARPPAGRYTAAEQNWRFPGDMFCDFTPMLVNQSLTWPDFVWLFGIGFSSVVSLSYWLAEGAGC